ncbi:MAG: aminoacyl-histidine dipeptidase [Desulfobacteraceae bacterium]|nr:aminoacyl-histidine dipeptidase [Desulfobacteraceae bacterium]
MDPKTKRILDLFQQINEIPRCSKNEEKIVHWLKQWAVENQFPVKVDAAGNMVTTVSPSAGYEHSPGIVIQGHVDMVCEKSPDADHNFSKDPIRHVFEGDWLRADKTTLGADNGIAIAMAMALATDNKVAHPTLELLFTVDEETGLNGAKLLEPGFVKGKVLLNVDSETEGEFTVGCAGGRHTHVSRKLTFTGLNGNDTFFGLKIQGLHGGHSGIDINKNRANANKVLARTLDRLSTSCPIYLISLKGGTAHNAIPRDAAATFACDPSQAATVVKVVRDFEKTLQSEYAAVEPLLAIALSPVDCGPKENTALSKQETRKVIDLILSLPHGVMGMSPDFEGLVETSNNLATVEIIDGSLKVLTSQRSSVMSRMDELTAIINATASLAGADSQSGSEYPPWTPTLQSALLKRCKEVYEKISGRQPTVLSLHAGLECAIIGEKYEGMDMISFGPTMQDPHSPNERLFIPSIGKVWDFMVALLESYKV